MHRTAVQGILNPTLVSRLTPHSRCPCLALHALATLSFSLVPRYTEHFLMVLVHMLLPLSGES